MHTSEEAAGKKMAVGRPAEFWADGIDCILISLRGTADCRSVFVTAAD
jgi:hypothetical protein